MLEQAAKAAASACPRCALPAGPYADLRGGCGDCRGRSLGFEAAVALGPYEGTLRDLCLRMKHDRDAWLAPWLFDLWAEARGEAVDRLGLADGRLGRAGPAALAAALGARVQPGRGAGARPGPAARSPGPPAAAAGRGHQASWPRCRPPSAAAALRKAFRAGRSRSLRGRTILLVDDVLTTGATCSAAARALRRAGAGRVIVAVIARTGKTTQ